MTSTIELFRPRSTVERRLHAAARWCLLLSGVAAAGGLLGFLLVLGGVVTPGWAVSATLLAVALIISLVQASVRRQLDRSSGEALLRRRSGWWAAFAVVAVACTGLLALDDIAFEATYKVLQPSGPGFCQAVVREHSFLFSGGGELYAVGFGGIGRSVSSWSADDGYRPIRYGTYEFTWTAEGHSCGSVATGTTLFGLQCMISTAADRCRLAVGVVPAWAYIKNIKLYKGSS